MAAPPLGSPSAHAPEVVSEPAVNHVSAGSSEPQYSNRKYIRDPGMSRYNPITGLFERIPGPDEYVSNTEGMGIVLEDYEPPTWATDVGLTLRQHDNVTIYGKVNSVQSYGNSNGRNGIFPTNHVKITWPAVKHISTFDPPSSPPLPPRSGTPKTTINGDPGLFDKQMRQLQAQNTLLMMQKQNEQNANANTSPPPSPPPESPTGAVIGSPDISYTPKEEYFVNTVPVAPESPPVPCSAPSSPVLTNSLPTKQDTGLTVPVNEAPPNLCSPHYHQQEEDGRKTPPVPNAQQPPDDMTNLSPQERMRRIQTELFDACKQDLFCTSRRTTDSSLPKTSVVNLTTLQHGSLHMLQRDLAVYVTCMYGTGAFLPAIQGYPSLQELLDKYCAAVRNLDYMKEAAKRGYDQDPFLMKSSRGLERQILETVNLIPGHVLPKGPLPPPNQTMLSPMGRNRANREAYEQQRWLRFSMAAVGGLLLLVPVLIMANVPGKIASLTTTSVSMLVFAVLITWLTELDPNGVLAATAGYAAVLVVFVGTTTTPSH